MPADKRSSSHSKKKTVFRPQKKAQDGRGKTQTLLDDAVAQMNAGKYGRASSALKQVLAGEPEHPEALRLFATLHLKLGSLMAAKTSFDSLARKAIEQKDYRLAESLLREYLAVAPRYVPFLELLAEALEADGDSMAAITEYGNAVEILVEDRDPEQMVQATELYAKIKQLGPDSSVAKKFVDVIEAGSSEAPVDTSPLKWRDEGASAQFPWAPTEETEALSYAEEPDASPLPLPESPTQSLAPEEGPVSSQLVEPTEVPDVASPSPWEEPPPAVEPRSLDQAEQQMETSPTVQGQATSKKGTQSSESSKKPWERQGTPAPFPWEATEESTEAPTVSGLAPVAESSSSTQEEAVAVPPGEPFEGVGDEAGALASQDEGGPQAPVLESAQDKGAQVLPVSEEEPLPEDDAKFLSEFLAGRQDRLVSEVPSPEVDSVSPPEEVSSGGPVPLPEVDGQQTGDASLAQAAAEALAAFGGEPGASMTPAASAAPPMASDLVLDQGEAAGTVELPQVDNLQTEDTSLAQAAAEALEALKEEQQGRPSGDMSTTESIVPEAALIEPVADVSDESSPQGHQAEEESLAPTASAPTTDVSAHEVVQEVSLEGDAQVMASDSWDVPAVEASSSVEEEVSPAFGEKGGEGVASEDQVSEQTIQLVESPPVTFRYATTEVSQEAEPPSVPEEPVGASAEAVPVVQEEPPKTVLPWDPVGQPLTAVDSTSTAEAAPAPPAEEPVASAPTVELLSFPQALGQEQAEAPVASPPEEAPVAPAARGFDLGILFPGEKDVQAEPVPPPAPTYAAGPVTRATSPTWAVPQMQDASQDQVSTKDLFPSLPKMRFKFRSFTRKVVSTARTIAILSVVLLTGCGLLGLVGVGILSLTWIGMEDKPSTSFHNLMQRPARPSLGARQNGYAALGRLGVVSSREPVRMAKGRSFEPRAEGLGAGVPAGISEVSEVMSGWYETWDPVAEFQKEAGSLKDWSTQYSALLTRYHGWLNLRFEDLGYGSIEGPDEFLILSVHRLYVAEGFAAGVNRGVRRLAQDLEAWRRALEKSKTLRFKMLALEGIQDDLAVVSGLLARRDLEQSLLPTLAKLSRPLTHQERSLRWPMQNQFVLEADQVKTSLKSDSSDTRSFHRKALTYLPLPFQQTMNGHAAYYDRLVKHDAVIKLEGDPRKGMPERYALAKTPANSVADYIVNPIDNLLQVGSRVDWRETTGRVLETEARLRLATLQARIRRPPQARDPISRIGKAGHDFYDPFTGFTMLLNASKTRMYSVGMDGIDNDADPRRDVAVPLFTR